MGGLQGSSDDKFFSNTLADESVMGVSEKIQRATKIISEARESILMAVESIIRARDDLLSNNADSQTLENKKIEQLQFETRSTENTLQELRAEATRLSSELLSMRSQKEENNSLIRDLTSKLFSCNQEKVNAEMRIAGLERSVAALTSKLQDQHALTNLHGRTDLVTEKELQIPASQGWSWVLGEEIKHPGHIEVNYISEGLLHLEVNYSQLLLTSEPAKKQEIKVAVIPSEKYRISLWNDEQETGTIVNVVLKYVF